LDTIVLYVVSALLEKDKTINVRLDRHLGKKFGAYFKSNPDLLKQAFEYNQSTNSEFDPYGEELKVLIDFDPTAVLDMIRLEVKKRSFGTSGASKFDFIWDLPDYKALVDQAIDIIHVEHPYIFNSEHPVNLLFKKISTDFARRDIAWQYIKDYIERNNISKTKIHLIFNVVTYSFSGHLLTFLKQFLLLNKEVDFVQDLFLEKSETINGDAGPVYDAEIKLYQNIIEMTRQLPGLLRYSGHINYWESIIKGIEIAKDQVKRIDFTGFGY
jgi:hypothetical protein